MHRKKKKKKIGIEYLFYFILTFGAKKQNRERERERIEQPIRIIALETTKKNPQANMLFEEKKNQN
jgi:hypothetical protein